MEDETQCRIRTPQSGQAAVESALTLPLVVFLFLGTLQLFLALQARILSQYAVFRAVRAGSVNHGNCDAMTHAALASLLPTFTRTDSRAKLVQAFRAHSNLKFAQQEVDQGVGTTVDFNGDILWLFRSSPVANAVPDPEDVGFDQGSLTRLEAKLVFWFPMRIPFANWVINKMVRAHYGFESYNSANPLLLTKKQADWPGSDPIRVMDAQISSGYLVRSQREYVLPIVATYSMRMMTPARAVNFRTQNCPPTP